MEQVSKKDLKGCGMFFIGALILSYIITLFQGGGYDVVKEEGNKIYAVAEVDRDYFSVMAEKINSIVYSIATKYDEADEIILTFTYNSENLYGNATSTEFSPYQLDRSDIVKINKFSSKSNFESIATYGTMILMNNGFFP